MSISRQISKQQPANNKNRLDHPSNTTRQQQIQDAIELANIIYDIFRYNPSNTNIVNESSEDDQNVQ